MASIYARGRVLWLRYKNEKGEWCSRRTRYTVGQEREAQRYAREAQAMVDKRRAAGHTEPAGPRTVKRWATEWIQLRREQDHDWKADQGRLKKHVLPAIGDRLLESVRAADLAELVHGLRFVKRLAPRTVRNVYSVIAAMFRDAAVRGQIDQTPAILTEAELGRIKDKDPEWRAGALFTRAEAEALISDPRIPEDRRVVYALGVLLGLRPGEAAALRWSHYDAAAEPLGRLLVARSYSTKRGATKGTKTETVKSLPVHPTLAAVLKHWRDEGWARMMGHPPAADDLIVPLPPATIARRTRRTGEPFRGYDYTGKRWREEDLPALGWRHRAVYDLRATFVTLVLEDGADPDVIRDRVTHTKQRRSAFDGYDRGVRWRETCAEVAKLRLATPLATLPPNPNDSNRLLSSGGGYRMRKTRGRSDG